MYADKARLTYMFFYVDPWCLLSDEMILSVFGWLSKATLARCARVCKKWKTLV